MGTIVVHSRLRNAIELHVDEMFDGESGAYSINPGDLKTAKRKGDAVELRPGRNEIDADFWREWAEQNKDGGFLISGSLRAEEERKKEED